MSIGAGIFCIVAALIIGALYFAQFVELNRYKAVCDEFFAPPEVYTMVVYHGRDEAFVSGLISLITEGYAEEGRPLPRVERREDGVITLECHDKEIFLVKVTKSSPIFSKANVVFIDETLDSEVMITLARSVENYGAQVEILAKG